jgi:hypothetical protein
MALVNPNTSFDINVYQDNFNGTVWVNVVDRVVTILLPTGFFSDPNVFASNLAIAWQAADFFLSGTRIFWDSTTSTFNFTNIVPNHTPASLPATNQVRYWFQPINDVAFQTAWELQGLENIFNTPSNFGPPGDTSFYVDTANFDTIVTSDTITYFNFPPPVPTIPLVNETVEAPTYPTNTGVIIGATIGAAVLLAIIMAVVIVVLDNYNRALYTKKTGTTENFF